MSTLDAHARMVPDDPSADGPRPAPGAPGTAPQAGLGVAGIDRRTATFVVGVLVVVWIVLVFARAVAQSNDVAARAGQLRAQDAGIAQQVADRQAELAIIQSPTFMALEARAYGYGSPKEQVFALRPGAPPPPTIAPLGADPAPAGPRRPLDAWLQLLFGH